MLFSNRLRLSKEYEKWLIDESEGKDFQIKDCALSVIGFLDSRNLLRDFSDQGINKTCGCGIELPSPPEPVIIHETFFRNKIINR